MEKRYPLVSYTFGAFGHRTSTHGLKGNVYKLRNLDLHLRVSRKVVISNLEMCPSSSLLFLLPE